MISRSIARRASKTSSLTKNNAKSSDYLPPRNDDARSRRLKTEHWSRCAACAPRRRLTGAVVPTRSALRWQRTRRSSGPCLSLRPRYPGHIRWAGFLGLGLLTVLVLESGVVDLTGSDGFLLHHSTDFWRRR